MKERRKRVYELHIGAIEEIRQEHSVDKTNKRLYCDVTLDNGVKLIDVEFWGGGVDLSSGKPHGIFIPPVENQIVGILFIQGHYQNPVACFPFPHPMNRKNIEKYYNILDDIDDGAIFHKSGSKVIMKKNGDVEITQAANKEIRIGETPFENIVKGVAFQSLYNAHTHTATALGSPTTPPIIPMSAAQLSQNNKVGK